MFWMFSSREIFPDPAGIRTPHRPTHSLVSVLTQLSQLYEYHSLKYLQIC
jgi:hypothetical protein